MLKEGLGEIVLMSPNNGQLVVGVPLYTRTQCEYGIIIVVEPGKPLVYAIDCGPEFERVQFLSAEWVEENLINLGEL